jgi:hypothetical protein
MKINRKFIKNQSRINQKSIKNQSKINQESIKNQSRINRINQGTMKNQTVRINQQE